MIQKWKSKKKKTSIINTNNLKKNKLKSQLVYKKNKKYRIQELK